MTYILYGILAAYLIAGLILTRTVLRPNRRLRYYEVALGAVFMPILFIFLLLCIFFEDLWKRLLIALDFDPPEEMRAGPKDPSDDVLGDL